MRLLHMKVDYPLDLPIKHEAYPGGQRKFINYKWGTVLAESVFLAKAVLQLYLSRLLKKLLSLS